MTSNIFTNGADAERATRRNGDGCRGVDSPRLSEDGLRVAKLRGEREECVVINAHDRLHAPESLDDVVNGRLATDATRRGSNRCARWNPRRIERARHVDADVVLRL